MSESMERSLGLCEWLRLRLHLFVCAWCTRYLKQIRFLRQLLREEPRGSGLQAVLSTEARQRMIHSIVRKS
jgi:hypothetical protein